MFVQVSNSPINFKFSITRSSYLKGLQCSKYLWLHRNQPLKHDKYDVQREIFKQIDALLFQEAYRLFPNGQSASTHKNLNEEDWHNSIVKTKELLENNEEVIYRPSFQAGELLCDIDLLVNTNHGLELVTIKSASKFSERNLHGAAFQTHVVRQAGFQVAGVKVVLLNQKYRKKGKINPRELFSIKDISEKVSALLPEAERNCLRQIEVLKGTSAPQVPIGIHCTEPHDCSYKFKCWKNVPKNSVFELVGFSKAGMFDLWKRGIKTIDEIPNSQKLAEDQQIQKEGKPKTDPAAILEFLNSITYPTLLVDFEGFMPAIPLFENNKPFELLPFLYCGYILSSEQDKGIPVSYIAPPNRDPRPEFFKHFAELCSSVNSILIYDPLTEKTILKNLKRQFPDYKPEVDEILGKVIDLSKPLAKKHFYLPKMKGYWGMKNVLPAIAPDLHYANLPINTGRQAATVYQLLYSNSELLDTEKTLKDLTEYCERDALGMLKLFKTLLEVVK